jgi:hypothetical protein
MMPRAETDRDCRLPPGVLGAPPTQAAMILLDTVIPVGPRPSTAQGEPSQRDPWAAVVLLPHKGRRASGHNIALENPAALAQAYLDFFAGG